MKSIYDFTIKDAIGNVVSMKNYEGKLLLIVNTATGCGFTPQYQGLQKLYEKYKDLGFEILDFPCNQFAGQAPGTESEIQSFCISRYGTSFKLFAKVKVNGKDTEPLFAFLKEKQGGVFNKDIKWNFTKFLIDRKGNVVKRYAPTVTPETIDNDLIKLLE